MALEKQGPPDLGLDQKSRPARKSERIALVPDIWERVLNNNLEVPNVPDQITLSGQEFEALSMLVDGHSNGEIAEAFGVRANRANKLVSRVYRKAGATNFPHLIGIVATYSRENRAIDVVSRERRSMLISELAKNSSLPLVPSGIRQTVRDLSQEFGVPEEEIAPALILYARDHEEQTIRALAHYRAAREPELKKPLNKVDSPSF